MNNETIATAFYREILVNIHHNESLPEQVKFEEVYRFLNRLFVFITEKEKLQFTTQFARIAFACHKHNVPQRTQWYVHEFRNKAKGVLYHNKPFESDYYPLGLKALADTLQAVHSVAIPADLQAILPKEGFYKKTPVEAVAFKDYARVMVLEVREEEEILLCQDEAVTEGLVKVKYNETGVNELFTSAIKSIKKGWNGNATLNLLEVSVDAKGVYYPAIMVIEPDYLLDVSAVASCFSPKGEPMLYLLKKFLPFENTIPLAVGNIANFLLDELMSDSEVDFNTIFPKVFQSNPIGFTVFTDAEIKDIYNQSKRHFVHLRQMVKSGFEDHEIDPKDCYLEPSFYAEKYGIQGRLDIWYDNRRNSQNSAIVELKSGSAYMPNLYGISESHYMQALLYDLLIKSVFNQSDPRNYILYSKLPQDQLRFAPAVKAKQNEGINLRNNLVAIEQTLVNMHQLEDKNFTLLDYLSPHKFPHLKGFDRKNLEYFNKVFSSVTALERNYFLSFVSFTAREHQLAKTGIQGIDNLNGLASLWLNSYNEKNDNFEIIAHLKVKPGGNRAKEDEALVTFLKTEGKTNDLANFRMGDIAILYPSNHPERGETALHNQIFKCTIINIDHDEVTVRLRSKQFNDRIFSSAKQSWLIEHDTMDHSFNSMYQGLFSFLNADLHKKNLLLSTTPPRLSERSLESVELDELAEGMTEQQQLILKKAIVAEDYFLLWGPPGTGKTSVMLRNLVAYLIQKTDKNILLLAYTNRAVDEICEAIQSIDEAFKEHYIRIGSRYSSHPNFHNNLFEKKIEGVKRREELKTVIDKHRIFVATVASMSNKMDLLHLKQFDTVIIDEASQILEPMLMGLLPMFKKFILVGDHKQLPAVVSQSVEHSAISLPSLQAVGLQNMRDSLFERLFLRCLANEWTHAFDMLSYQGRMHQAIMDFPNEHFYGGKLHILPSYCGVDQSSEMALSLPENAPSPLEKHLARHRFSFISTPSDSNSRTRKTNSFEAKLIAKLVDSYCNLYTANGKAIDYNKTIGIITPYRAQIAQIKQELETYGKGYEHFSVDTVERYQGSAREIVLLSLCLNHADQLSSLVSLSTDGQVDRKLNVALTRARKHLVVVGNKELLAQDAIYKALIGFVEKRRGEYMLNKR